MNKKQILEQWFTDVEIVGREWFFTHENKKLLIHDYPFSNIVANLSESRKEEILSKAENQYQYFMKKHELKPRIRFFRIRDTKFSDGKPTKSIQRYSWDFENWQGVTDEKTREFLKDPEKLKTYADEITRDQFLEILNDK